MKGKNGEREDKREGVGRRDENEGREEGGRRRVSQVAPCHTEPIIPLALISPGASRTLL